MVGKRDEVADRLETLVVLNKEEKEGVAVRNALSARTAAALGLYILYLAHPARLGVNDCHEVHLKQLIKLSPSADQSEMNDKLP